MASDALPQLAAFALVAEEYERSGDAVRGLRPLFASALSRYADGPYVPEKFASSFSELFGISMAPYVAKSLAPKLVEIDLLVQDGARFAVVKDLAKFVPPSISDQELPKLLAAFSAWAAKQLSHKGLELPREDLEAEFQARLSRPEFAAGFFDEDEESRTARLRSQLFSGSDFVGRERDVVFDFLAAKFITFAHANVPELFESMARVSSGALIAEAVAGLSSPSGIAIPNEGLRVVVDGPLLLDYLDLNTPEQHVYVKQMLDELRALGFMLVTFDHVIDEMRMLINAALKEYAAGREYGPLGVRLRSQVGFSTYATAIRDSLERRLKDDLGLVVLRYDIYDQADRYKYFSEAQFDSLRNSLGDLHHQFERRERDAKSIAGVIRLKRENRRAQSIFGSGTFFLTRNSRLAKDATRFLAAGRSEADPRYAVVLDSQLLPIIWFSQGAAEKFGKMSRERLIANCAAAMVPHREVVQRIAEFLSKIDPKLRVEFSALMSDDRAKLCPMNVTLGMSSSIDERVAREMVEEMRSSLAAPIIAEAREKELRYEAIVGELSSGAELAKDTILVMQDKVTKFDSDLAQAFLDRDQHAARAAERERMVRDIARGKVAEANEMLAGADRLARATRRTVAFALWAFVVVSTSYGVISGDQRGYLAAGGTLVGALLFGTGQQWAEALLDRVLDRFLSGGRERARGMLQEAERIEQSLSGE